MLKQIWNFSESELISAECLWDVNSGSLILLNWFFDLILIRFLSRVDNYYFCHNFYSALIPITKWNTSSLAINKKFCHKFLFPFTAPTWIRSRSSHKGKKNWNFVHWNAGCVLKYGVRSVTSCRIQLSWGISRTLGYPNWSFWVVKRMH